MMTKSYESAAAKVAGVGAHMLPRTWVAAILVLFMSIAGLWAADARAQSAAADQTAPKLANATCLGCHGQEGFAPARTSEPKFYMPMVLKDRFQGSVHGQRVGCVECHTNITKVPHEKVEVKVGCVNCHRDLLNKAQDENKPAATAKLSGVVEMIDR